MKYKNPITNTLAAENESNGMHGDEPIYCPVNAYSDCPYCDKCLICHIANPMRDCDDFAASFDSWEDWESL